MSGFLAAPRRLAAGRWERAVRDLDFLGGDLHDEWQDDRIALALTRTQWEAGADFSGGAALVASGPVVVAADATLYDRDTLVTALRGQGVLPTGTSPAHLIAAAYHAWGRQLAAHLNGDFAFVLWDAAQQRLLAARDQSGLRPLFFGARGASAVVGSSSRAIAELLGSAGTLNLAVLGAEVAGLPWAAGRDTAYATVSAVPPAHVLVACNGRVQLERYWTPPAAPATRPTDAREARATLRELLATAVAERLGSDRTTVWMSGGWDSTAVFAAGQHALPPGERARLRPVSISYPPGDPGREDELIESAAAHWGATVQWLHSVDIPLLDALEQRAAETDEPPAHLYELWNRALARATRATGARIALDGGGGDQLFQVSDIILADLVRAGRWHDAATHARARGRGWRHAVRLGLLPLVPDHLVDAAATLLPVHLPRHYLERRIAPWMRRDFVREHALRERDLTQLRAVQAASFAQRESLLFLTLPIWGWGAAYMRGAFLQEGVETRSPLLDRRVIEFALSRPVEERASAHDTKLLLREAMQGLLPPSLLARRPMRTGTTAGFSRMRMREAYPALVARLFAQPLRLAELGMVEPAALRAGADQVVAGEGGEFQRVTLFHAMKVEFWLRGLGARAWHARAESPSPFAADRRELRGPVARTL